MLDGTGGIRALVVPDGAVAQARIPHAVEDIRMARLGKNQHRRMGFHRGDQVFVFAGDIQKLDLLQVHLRVVGEILEPGQDMGIVEKLLFHRMRPPLTV